MLKDLIPITENTKEKDTQKKKSLRSRRQRKQVTSNLSKQIKVINDSVSQDLGDFRFNEFNIIASKTDHQILLEDDSPLDVQNKRAEAK